MVPRSFSVLYAIRTLARRKQRNIYAVLGITLGVSLLLGVQVSNESLKVGWETFFIRTIGEYDAQLIPLREPYVNESAVWELIEATRSLDRIEAMSGRLVLSTTVFQPDTGRIELGVPLLGISINETDFGEFIDHKDGTVVDVDQTDQLLVGENLAEELALSEGDHLTIVFAQGNFRFNLTKQVYRIYSNEDRGRENFANSMVIRLDLLQAIQGELGENPFSLAEYTGYDRPVNYILIKFHKSINNMDEAKEALDELKELSAELFAGEELREIVTPITGQANFSLSMFPQVADVSLFQFLDENLSTSFSNWTATDDITLSLNESSGIASLKNDGIENTGYIELSGLSLNTSTLGDLLINMESSSRNTIRIMANAETVNESTVLDVQVSNEFMLYSKELNSSSLLTSLRIYPVESGSEISIDFIGVGKILIHNQSLSYGSELQDADQFVINLEKRQIELYYINSSNNWQTVYGSAAFVVVNYEGTYYRRNYGEAFFYYSPTRYTIKKLIGEMLDLIGQVMMIFGSLIVVAGLLLIINIQLASVQERERQIGILRAIGTKRPQILLTTILETILLGIVGSILGILGGVLYGTFLVHAMAWTFEFPAGEIPIVVNAATVQQSFFIGFIISLLTSILPSWRASNINIVEVMRGISPSPQSKFGKKGVYLGLLLFAVGLIVLFISGIEPWKGKKAWYTVEDAEALFFIILLPVMGLALVGSFYFSRRWSLNLMSFALIGWSLFNTFIVVGYDWIRDTSGSGGQNYMIGIALSLIAGTCLFVGVNLDLVAWGARKSTSIFRSTRALTLIAMQQMASKKIRSTLVFAIFSVVLTMNIFMSVWSYSYRYGTDELIELTSGGTDIVLVADQAIPKSIPFSVFLQDNFSRNDIRLVRGYSVSSENTPVFLEYDAGLEDAKFNYVIPIDNRSFWADNTFEYEGWTFQFSLGDRKIDEFEITDSQNPESEDVKRENEHAWRLVASDFHVFGTRNDVDETFDDTKVWDQTELDFPLVAMGVTWQNLEGHWTTSQNVGGRRGRALEHLSQDIGTLAFCFSTKHDFIIEADVLLTQNKSSASLAVPILDPQNGYFFGLRSEGMNIQVFLNRSLNGDSTTLNSTSSDFSLNEWINLDVRRFDQHLECYANEKLFYNVTDAHIMQGTFGLRAVGTDVFFDNIIGKQAKPVVISDRLTDIMEFRGAVQPGDSIWMYNRAYERIEFIVLVVHLGNALTDWSLAAEGMVDTRGGGQTVFVPMAQAENLLAFDGPIESESLFLVEVPKNELRSDRNQKLAHDIEEWSNGQEGWFRTRYGIHGIAAIPVWEIYEVQLDGMYRFFTFMQIFTSGGFLVGLLGLLVVSMRSVQERKREIGMMRSLGFRKPDVICTVLFELVLMGLIGLVVGMINGALLAWTMVDVTSGGVAKFLIPVDIIALYTTIILGSAFVAAVIPGWLASKIPPSEALRYVG